MARPPHASFADFLLADARVPDAARPGDYTAFSFAGREVLRAVVRRIDHVLATGTPDARLALAGGAQFGKTILELNLAAFLTGQRFLRTGLFLPDDRLVEGVVDTKLRPDVVDQIPWFAAMTQIGRAVNRSGKTVQRKGAFMVTDGDRRSYGLVLGLQKIPTTFTLDVACLDEVDDIPERMARFVKGRLTSSPLRFTIALGTQRVNGRGMQREWRDGSQGVVLLGPVGSAPALDAAAEVTEPPAGWINPEEHFPGIVRMQLGPAPSADDPRLTWAGVFERAGRTHAFERTRPCYLADPVSGAPLDRSRPVIHHRAPARLRAEHWTLRVSQLGIGAIGVDQIVQAFCEGEQAACASSEAMTAFRCDVLALPQATTQALTPALIERAQRLAPFAPRLTRAPDRPAFAGLDVGDQSWFTAVEVESPLRRRAIWAAKIPSADLVTRAAALCRTLGIRTLFIDQRPEVSAARALALELNGLAGLTQWPAVPGAARDAWISLPGGLTWDGRQGRWRNLRCAVVRFDVKRVGGGIVHGFDEFEEGGVRKFVPLIQANRFETIDRVVRALLTPAEGVHEISGGTLRAEPALLLPTPVPHDPLPALLAEHLLTGSERARERDGTAGDYVDGCANHLLLALGYAALAEGEGGVVPAAPLAFAPLGELRATRREVRW